MTDKTNKNVTIFIKAKQLNKNTYAWAAFLTNGVMTKEISGIEKHKGLIPPEFIAAKNAIRQLKSLCNIKLFTENVNIISNLQKSPRLLKGHKVDVIKLTASSNFRGFKVAILLLGKEIENYTKNSLTE